MQHATHLLNLTDKTSKYEMDPTNINCGNDTEQTRFYGQMDKVKPVYPTFNSIEAGKK